MTGTPDTWGSILSTDHTTLTPSPGPSSPPVGRSKCLPGHATNDRNVAPFRASDHSSDHKQHLLLAASGSVATIKIPQILQALSHHRALSIRLILTPSASHFLAGQSAEQPPLSSLLSVPNLDGIYTDADEWAPAWARGAPILHIELRRWADMLVVAPLSADVMAKMVGGISDGLLTSVLRAWDTSGAVEGRNSPKRVVVCPAMNTAMWRHPVTAKQMQVLEEEWGWERGGWIEVLRPVEKELACGDVGDGAMKEWRVIVGIIEERLALQEEDLWERGMKAVVGKSEGG